ncbi:hypothetical protein [Jiulongibacter sp. NS-SX5]
MKLKVAILLFLGTVALSSCSKKQCPAYSSTQATPAETVKA